MKVHTAVLGAGFSLELGRLPLVDDLGELVRAEVTSQAEHDERRRGVFRTAPEKFERGSFERWLSRVAEPQPDLDDETNAANQFAFQVATRAIHHILVEQERAALGAEVPVLLERLVTCWHELRATVITFNYDTLVERAATQIVNRNVRHLDPLNQAISTYKLLNNVPPQAERLQMGYGSSDTMRIIKLHGSLDTFWVPGDASGTTIARLGEMHWDARTGATRVPLDLERIMPGRVPFIVPPASAKSALLSNPVTRQLWRTAAEHLARSSRIDIVGYSLPITDLVASAMLAESFRAAQANRMLKRASGDPRILVANPVPNPVLESLESAGVDRTDMSTLEGVEEYAVHLERELADEDRPHLFTDLHSGEHVFVRARDGKMFGVREVARVGDKIRLTMHSESVPVSANLLDMLRSTPDAQIEVYRKGISAAIIGHEITGEDGALVLIPSWLDSSERH